MFPDLAALRYYRNSVKTRERWQAQWPVQGNPDTCLNLGTSNGCNEIRREQVESSQLI